MLCQYKFERSYEVNTSEKRDNERENKPEIYALSMHPRPLDIPVASRKGPL